MSIVDAIQIGLFGVIALVALWICTPAAFHWLRARFRGVQVDFFSLVGMRLRKVHVGTVLDAAIHARRAGLKVSITLLESHYLAGGDVMGVVRALAFAKSRGVAIAWGAAAVTDLAGLDVLRLVQAGVDIENYIGSPQRAADGDRFRKQARS